MQSIELNFARKCQFEISMEIYLLQQSFIKLQTCMVPLSLETIGDPRALCCTGRY